jgi:hypothetical protein
VKGIPCHPPSSLRFTWFLLSMMLLNNGSLYSIIWDFFGIFEIVTNIRIWIKSHRYWRML